MTAAVLRCGVCEQDVSAGPCAKTASGKHWFPMDADATPMPPLLAAALTAPENRTPEQHELMRRDAEAEEARRVRT